MGLKNAWEQRLNKLGKSQVNVSALETTLNEIRNVYPGVTNLMVLDETNQVIARDRTSNDELVNQVSSSFETLAKRASIIGGIESLTFEGADQRIFFTRHQEVYLATVASNQLDYKEITNLTHILFTTTLKVIQEVVSYSEARKAAPAVSAPAPIEPPKPKISEPIIKTVPNFPTQPQPMPTPVMPGYSRPMAAPMPVSKPQIAVPEVRCKVENVSGLSIVSDSPDAIRLDRALIGEWSERYGAKKIDEAYILDVEAKKVMRCKFAPIKSEKLEGQGLVLVPHKVQGFLGVKKGSTVIVKPAVE
jgi:hypothetical protein